MSWPGDPRLVRALRVGPVTGVAWHDEGPLLAVRTREEVGHRVRVWDVLSAEPTDVPGREPPYRMAFGRLAGATVLVCAHGDDGLRIWDVAGRRALTTVPVGDRRATDVHLGESGGRLVAVTLDQRGRVHRWSLPDGTYLGGLAAPATYALVIRRTWPSSGSTPGRRRRSPWPAGCSPCPPRGGSSCRGGRRSPGRSGTARCRRSGSAGASCC
ncbi:MAG: hypothetical protein ABW046_18380 [Actinoplanes sp.]